MGTLRKLIFIIIFFISFQSFAKTWVVNKDHSSLSFSIPFMGVGEVVGNFTEVEGNVDLQESKVSVAEIRIPVKSLSTGSKMRDTHLKRSDFFHAKKYPFIKIKINQQRIVNGEDLEFKGIISAKSESIPFTASGKITGETKDTWGHTSRFVSVTTQLKLSSFPFSWNKILPGGKMMLGEKIVVKGSLQLQPSGELTPSSKHMVANTKYIQLKEKVDLGLANKNEIATFKKASVVPVDGQVKRIQDNKAKPNTIGAVVKKVKVQNETDWFFWMNYFILVTLAGIGVTYLSISVKTMFLNKYQEQYAEGTKIGLISDAIVLIPILLFAISSYWVGWPS